MIQDSFVLHCLSDLILHWQNLIAYTHLTEEATP